MNEVLTRIQETAIIPVVKIDRAEDAKPLAKALCDGGLPCAEITFRTPAAKEAIRIMKEAFPHMLIGAGTVLTTAQVDDAIEAGAEFIVSPGLNPTTVNYCQEKGVTVIPGCITPTEVELAIALGLEVVKFFPAQAAGGLPMIKAMAAPFGQVRFMPTGGINSENVAAYLAFSKVIACGGSWMVSEERIQAGEFEKIKTLTQEAVKLCVRKE